jgi:hypothetical protein
MVNKVLGAYVAADFLFVATGAILVGFSVIVQNFMFETPTEGQQAVRNLLYQEFPLTGTPLSPARKAEYERVTALRTDARDRKLGITGDERTYS